jgi:DNA-binding winged helix-turn-helix (wHTH) protein/tetratricopeptide (TPR) repeat protein
MSLSSRRIYHFGEFRLRVSARVLERDGKPVPLGSKAFEVLTCLVMHSGEVVTKDELLKTVWPESFVEEGNLSQHIFALRRALGDRAAFIVTVPGRGYQFTETVQEVVEPAAPAPVDSGTFLLQRTRERTHIVIEETSSAGPASASNPPVAVPSDSLSRNEDERTTILRAARPGTQVTVPEGATLNTREWPGQSGADQLGLPGRARRGRISPWAIVAVSGVALVAGWFTWRRFVRPPAVNQRVVLAELDNRTGDAGFDVVLRNALEIDLDQSPYMDVMGAAEEMNTLRLMGRSMETALVPAVAREVCERSNRQVLIAGSVASVGQTYLLTLEATDCDSGKILAGAKVEAARKEQLLAALDSASAKLRRGLGESAESLERFQVPIAQATTSSLEALQQYSIGEYLLGRIGKEENEVLPFFQRALELDPQFAMASAAIATGYFSLGESELAGPYYQKAFDLSGQVSEKERLYIRAHYYSDDKRDVRQGIQAYQMWAETYPRDWGPWLNIANEYSQVGFYNAAIVAGERALQLDPSRGIVYSVLARDYLHVGRYADAEATAKRAELLGRDSNMLHATLFETALLEHDQAAANREIGWSEGKEGEWNFLDLQALAAAKDGRYKRAEELFRTAYDAAISENLPEKADDILIDEASADFDCGMTADARAALKRVSLRQPESPAAALVQAELGDAPSAEHALAAYGDPGETDTLLSFVDGPRIRGEIALNGRKPQEAIADLQPALEYDFAGGFATIAERGDAYLKAKQPEKAAIEYRKILDHPGVDPVSPLYPLARLGEARAEAQGGNVAQSKADYEALFVEWKDADPDLPVFVTTRREYAALSAARPATRAKQ